jgi:hypothetical protein
MFLLIRIDRYNKEYQTPLWQFLSVNLFHLHVFLIFKLTIKMEEFSSWQYQRQSIQNLEWSSKYFNYLLQLALRYPWRRDMQHSCFLNFLNIYGNLYLNSPYFYHNEPNLWIHHIYIHRWNQFLQIFSKLLRLPL